MGDNKLSIQSLPDRTASLFNKMSIVAKSGLMDDFLLIGGTAMTIRFNHRLSEDLDFTIGSVRLPTKAISGVIALLCKNGCDVV